MNPATFASPSFLLPADADTSILTDFIIEACEHLESSDQHLLTLESDPGERASLDAVFRAFHSIKGVTGFLGLEGIKTLAHEAENLLDQIRTGSIKLSPSVMDCVFDCVAFLKGTVADLKRGVGEEDDRRCQAASIALRERISAILRGDVATESWTASAPQESESAAPESPDSQAEVPPVVVVQAEQPRAEGPEPTSVKTNAPAMAIALKETVKVDATRLDRLLDAIGELVIAESMVLGSPELKRSLSPALVQKIGQLDKITRELQEMGTSLRMVPVRPTFQKMQRLVRDLAKQSGKAVEFVTDGEETELDKTVVEKISDPLVHMLRNSLDHGIESDPEARVRAGKPRTARVRLSAFQKGGSVCIEIADDGRGLNRDAILAKARERGLWREEAPPSDKEIFGFIFEAGFSTAKQVTELSGRGVGMDVVKRNIESLRGRIDIQSRPGEGTTFSIWLPLSLAIIDGMVVRIGGDRFIFPTLSIVCIATPAADAIHTVQGQGEMLRLQDELIPIYPLRGFLCGDRSGDRRLLVVAEGEGRKAAFPVDELLDQQQIVIKKLEESFPPIPGISGGAILTDGRVGLILDVDALMKFGFQP
ncbi:MAG: chemotaxis protein CheA [Fibrobacteres bacterium]|nr:chemotaxis protein CheA [Fibrobacterota bacterium]